MPVYPISLDDSSPMASIEPSNPRKHYPTLNLHWKKSYDLPEDGVLTVKYHKRKETNIESDDGDSQSVELEILTIENVKAEKGEKKSPRKEAEEALDSYAAEAEDVD